MLERDKSITTDQKALALNLDENKYGTIVEIGAGQEVARRFFKVGAAAGTIAKTMSAYDMKVSDSIYGKAGRYVSQERVEQMARHEYKLCVERLENVRSPLSTYFSYAATVTARSYKGGNECHGWIALRVQLRPKEEPCEIICHVRMLDHSNELQSEALGVLGVNLIYGAFFYNAQPKWIIDSLNDGLGSDRIEVDLILFNGPGFNYVDNRLMNLHLVHAWLTRAVMFDPEGNPVVPRDALYKRPVMVSRGSCKPPTKVLRDMEVCGIRQMEKTVGVDPQKIVSMAEISMSQLVTNDIVDDRDFLTRMQLACAMGFYVLLSDYVRYFSLRSWFRRHTQEPIALTMKASDLNYLFDRKVYEGLEGGSLEGLGKLFADNTSVLVYPNLSNGEIHCLENVQFPETVELVAQQLMRNNKLVALDGYDETVVNISARSTIQMINSGEKGWEDLLEPKIANMIKEQSFFGYRA
ncbi:MAG: hypothetical protein ACFHHU_07895 [Porticoccaceae bacterium]